jgi:hypothetical protein
MIPKGGHRFSACAKPLARLVLWLDASAGEGWSDKIMLKQIRQSGMTLRTNVIAL